jgi:hypothetical protein
MNATKAKAKVKVTAKAAAAPPAAQFFFFYSGATEAQMPAYRNAAANCTPPLQVTEVSVDSGTDPNLKYWGSGKCVIECVVVRDGARVKGSCDIFPEQLCAFFSPR